MAMVQTLQANEVDLRTLINTFGLRRVRNRQFFREWQEDLPALDHFEQEFLDRIQAGYLNLIESKRAAFSMDAGLAQLLAYMLGKLHPHRPGFGMVATGGTFTFVKLVHADVPQFSTSDQFGILNQVNGLYDAFRILRHIGQL